MYNFFLKLTISVRQQMPQIDDILSEMIGNI